MLRSTHRLVGLKLFEPRPRRFVKFWLKDDENPHSLWKPIRTGGAPCIRVHPDQGVYSPAQAANGFARPYGAPNLWISGETDFSQPEGLTLAWDSPIELDAVYLSFDTDLDCDLDVLWEHHQRKVIDTCVRSYAVQVRDASGGWKTVADVQDNYQRRRVHRFGEAAVVELRVSVKSTWGAPYASIYEIRVYREGIVHD